MKKNEKLGYAILAIIFVILFLCLFVTDAKQYIYNPNGENLYKLIKSGVMMLIYIIVFNIYSDYNKVDASNAIVEKQDSENEHIDIENKEIDKKIIFKRGKKIGILGVLLCLYSIMNIPEKIQKYTANSNVHNFRPLFTNIICFFVGIFMFYMAIIMVKKSKNEDKGEK